MTESQKTFTITKPVSGEQAASRLHKIAEQPKMAREDILRLSLEKEKVVFFPRDRLVFLPPIITDLYATEDMITSSYSDDKPSITKRFLPAVNLEQVKKLIPLEPENNYNMRIKFTAEAIQDLASFLTGEIMLDEHDNHTIRTEMKYKLLKEHPEFDEFYRRNQLRGSKLIYAVASLDEISRVIGNKEIEELGAVKQTENVKAKFKKWSNSIEDVIKGRQGDSEPWSTPGFYTNKDRIAIVMNVNNIIIETLQILSTGMSQPNTLVRIT